MKSNSNAWRAMVFMLNYRGLDIKVKRCLYEGEIVPIALYGTETQGSAQREEK